MRRISRPHIPILAAALLLSGCGTFNRLSRPLGQAAATLFTSATLADDPAVSILGNASRPTVGQGRDARHSGRGRHTLRSPLVVQNENTFYCQVATRLDHGEEVTD